MTRTPPHPDPYVGVQPMADLRILEWVGQGKIGSVYKAARESNPRDMVACKVIPEGNLKQGWERELEKIAELKGIPNVLQYHWYGAAFDKEHRPFTFVLFDFIKGLNLNQYLERLPWPLDLAFIENIATTILRVLHACRAVGVVHGDLHAGNIMISDPDLRLPDSSRTIYITDFGYGGSHNRLEPKDDYRQFFSIIKTMLTKLDEHDLTPRDKVMYQKIEQFLLKRVLEVDPTQRSFVGDPTTLLPSFLTLASLAERESAIGASEDENKEPGDYLWAEALGYRVDEWKDLFVPEFLAAQDLLSRNITILTGARGCGKTMAFRRLTAFMDKVIGEPSRVRGADQFTGFYLNCRDLVEAFPWLPSKISIGMQQQIIHYFHLAWFSEICKTIALYEAERVTGFEWLDGFLTGTFGERYYPLPKGADVLSHARAFLDDQKERCRITNLGSSAGLKAWPLARIDLLDMLQSQLEAHVAWISDRPLYFFLDDYTIPIVTRDVQRILNPIVFKRRSKLFFKVSSEAPNSFAMEGLRGKPLELHQDFELIDLATYSLHQNDKAKQDLLDKIFRPRIDRHDALKGKNLGLRDVLGKAVMSNNALAWQMRKNAQRETRRGGRKRILYHGVDAFVGMWTSDIRILIQMFATMLREANGVLTKGIHVIGKSIQHKSYRSAGGEFLTLTESITSPPLWEKGPSSTIPGEPFGKHLRDIAETFISTSHYELTKGKIVPNQGQNNPKQAFRLEIIDKFDLPDDVVDYYSGLVRWHIFLQDWRGKSVRGMITPRLYLNRVLIPHANLTFSSHDNIHLTNQEFVDLLRTPKHFLKDWQEKRGEKGRNAKNLALFTS